MPSSVNFAPGRVLSDVTFAYLDTETTGLSPKTGGRVCEVAVVCARGGRETGRFQSLVNPDCPISYGAMLVHGITDEMVEQEPAFSELADELFARLDGTVVVAHNASFDVNFLQAEYTRLGRVMPVTPVVCTLRLARRHFKFPSNKLGSIAASLGVATPVAHRAAADAQTLRGIFERFLAALDAKGVRTLEDLLRS